MTSSLAATLNDHLISDDFSSFPVWSRWDAAFAFNRLCKEAEELGLFNSPEGLVFFLEEGHGEFRTIPYTGAKINYGLKTIDQMPVCEGTVYLDELQDYAELEELDGYAHDFIKRHLQMILDLANAQLAAMVA